MTLILVTKRKEFTVLAAEQFHGGVSRAYCQKVVPHPNPAIPIAFAIGGTAHLLLNGNAAPAREHLLDFANEIVSPDELDLTSIAKRLEQRISPGIEEKKGNAGVFIALVRNGEAAVGVQCFDYQNDRVKSTFYSQCRPWCPHEIEAAFDATDWAVLHDPTNTDPDSVADQARKLVQKGIDYDEKLHGGRHESCGGKVDVVVVDSTGARQK